jgi:hypothetical protein
MADMDRLYDALRKAHADGDTAAASRLAGYIREQQGQPTVQAQPEPAETGPLGPVSDTTPDVFEAPQLAPEPEMGRFETIGRGLARDIHSARKAIQATEEDVRRGRIGQRRAGLQQLGQILKTSLADVPSAAMGTAYQLGKTVTDLPAAAYASYKTGVPFGEVYGEALETPGPLARETGEAVGKTVAPVVRGVGQLVEKGYVKGDPTRARDIEALKGFAMAGTGVLGQRAAALKAADAPIKTTRPGALGKTADIIRMGETRDRAVMDLALPDDLAARKRFAARGKEVTGVGPLKEFKKKLHDYERQDVDNLVNLKGIDPSKTAQENINVINRAVEVENDKIVKALEGKTGGMSSKEIESKIRKSIDSAFKTEEGRLLKGTKTAQGNIDNTVKEFLEILDEQPGNRGIDIYRARRKMDGVIENNYINIWDDTKAVNSMRIINKAMRDATKEAIEEVAPGVGFSKSMDLQSSYLRSRDNMVGKAAKELETPMARVDKRFSEYGRMGLAGATTAAAKDVGAGATRATIAPLLDYLDMAIRAANPPEAKWLQAYKVAIIEQVQKQEEKKGGLKAP